MTLAQYFTDMGISSSKPTVTKDDFIKNRVWESSGGVGGVHEREKVEQNEAWKSLLPTIAPGCPHPALPSCDNIDTK